MKVALIYAKSQAIRQLAQDIFEDDSKVKGELARDEIFPPLGISILAAKLEELGHDIRLHDDSIHEIEDLRASMEWADMVGISILTPNARRGRELGQMSRQEFGKLTVMGGPHPTTNPEFFLESGAADICVQGEGDLTLPEIVESWDRPENWGEIHGMCYMKDGEMVQNPRRPLIKDVNAVPFPAYHLWDLDEYMRLMVVPGVPIITSRGCPYACTFCDAEMTPRQYRAMSPERTVDLIEHIVTTYNPPQLFFFDDLFTIQRKRVIGVCKEILKRDLFFEWSCESRIDTVDYEMLRYMRRAGCVKIYYGLESGSPKILQTMKKGVTPEKVLEGSKLNRQLGMYFKFFLIYGFPEDTTEDHIATEELIAAARPDAVCLSLLQPIPGTEVYEKLKPMLTKDVAEIEFHYWHGTETFKHPTFTFDELHAARERLLVAHSKSAGSLRAKVLRKAERLMAMIKDPGIVKDLFEIKSRKKRYLKRVRDSKWKDAAYGIRDRQAQQIPTTSGGVNH